MVVHSQSECNRSRSSFSKPLGTDDGNRAITLDPSRMSNSMLSTKDDGRGNFQIVTLQRMASSGVVKRLYPFARYHARLYAPSEASQPIATSFEVSLPLSHRRQLVP